MWGLDRKIRPEDGRLVLHGLPSDDKRWSWGTDVYFYALFLFIYLFFFIYLFIYFKNKLPEVPEYAKMQFHKMTSWVRYHG